MEHIAQASSLLKDLEQLFISRNPGKASSAELIMIREAKALLENPPAPAETSASRAAPDSPLSGILADWAGHAEIRDAFDISLEPSYHLRDRGFAEGTRAAYGFEIEILESPNDTTHEIHIREQQPLDAHRQETLDSILEDKSCECWRLNVVFQDLVNKGHLPPGKFYLRVSW